MSLPAVLAGPLLRRAEPGRVLVWLATSRPVTVQGEILSLASGGGGDGPRRLGRGGGRRVGLGPRLFIHLVSILPDPAVGAFPRNELLGYDLLVSDDAASGPPRRLGELGLLAGPRAVTLGDLPLPSFFLPARSAALNLLHGSCRLLHGHGEDALVAADELLAERARDLDRRPSALVLTGDQIYGDEVAGPLIGHLTRLGAELLGPGDTTSVPGVPALDRLAVYGRQELSHQLGFTSSKAGNHLFSLGEFAAMYLVAWDQATWPQRLPDPAEALPSGGRGSRVAARQRHGYAAELAGLEAARRVLPAVRRVLANLPTYMIFDDHDVTDDWNLTSEWHDQVWSSPGGRRVVANALAAYWAFQGWGNAPESFDEQFLASWPPALARTASTRPCGPLTAGATTLRPIRPCWSWTPAPSAPSTASVAPPGCSATLSWPGCASSPARPVCVPRGRRSWCRRPRSMAWSSRSDARSSWSTRSVPTRSTSRPGTPTCRDCPTSCGCSSTSWGWTAA